MVDGEHFQSARLLPETGGSMQQLALWRQSCVWCGGSRSCPCRGGGGDHPRLLAGSHRRPRWLAHRPVAFEATYPSHWRRDSSVCLGDQPPAAGRAGCPALLPTRPGGGHGTLGGRRARRRQTGARGWEARATPAGGHWARGAAHPPARHHHHPRTGARTRRRLRVPGSARRG